MAPIWEKNALPTFPPLVFAFPEHPPQAADHQCGGGHSRAAPSHEKALSPPGLRLDLERSGTLLGLPLPRLPV